MLHTEKTTGKYSFLDLSPFNDDLRVGGTSFQCFCYHESPDISKHTGTVQEMLGTKICVDTQRYTVFICTVNLFRYRKCKLVHSLENTFFVRVKSAVIVCVRRC